MYQNNKVTTYSLYNQLKKKWVFCNAPILDIAHHLRGSLSSLGFNKNDKCIVPWSPTVSVFHGVSYEAKEFILTDNLGRIVPFDEVRALFSQYNREDYQYARWYRRVMSRPLYAKFRFDPVEGTSHKQYYHGGWRYHRKRGKRTVTALQEYPEFMARFRREREGVLIKWMDEFHPRRREKNWKSQRKTQWK